MQPVRQQRQRRAALFAAVSAQDGVITVDLHNGPFHSHNHFLLERHHRTIASARFGGSFPPMLRFEKREIHKVFLRFPNLALTKNLSPNLLAELRGEALKFLLPPGGNFVIMYLKIMNGRRSYDK